MGDLRLFLEEPNNNGGHSIDGEFPETRPSLPPLLPLLTICRTVSCQNRAATLVATRAAGAAAAAAAAVALAAAATTVTTATTPRQSVRVRLGNQNSLGGLAPSLSIAAE